MAKRVNVDYQERVLAGQLTKTYSEASDRPLDKVKVYAELKRVQKSVKRSSGYESLDPQQKIETVMAELAGRIEQNIDGYLKTSRSASLKPGHGAEYKWDKNGGWSSLKDWGRGFAHLAHMGVRSTLPWKWHPVRGIKRVVQGTKDYMVNPAQKGAYEELRNLAEEHGDSFSDEVRDAIERGKTAEVYHTAVDIMQDSGLLKGDSRAFVTAKADLEGLGRRATKDAVKGMKRDIRRQRKKSLEEHAEATLSIILLSLITFSLVSSIIDNPSITGYAVLGVSNATNATLILNVIAFVFVLLLVYPSGDIIEQFKPVRKKLKTRRKRRK